MISPSLSEIAPGVPMKAPSRYAQLVSIQTTTSVEEPDRAAVWTGSFGPNGPKLVAAGTASPYRGSRLRGWSPRLSRKVGRRG